MYTTFTPTQIVLYAEISQYLATVDIQRKGEFGGGIDLNLPRKLYCIRKNVEWLLALDSSDETLPATSQYLYALCGIYGLQAQYRVSTGGNVSPISPISVAPDPIEFEVSSSSLIPIGGSTLYLPSWIGYNMSFVRGNQAQYQLPQSGTYFSWNKVTGQFVCYGSGVAGEFFGMYPEI